MHFDPLTQLPFRTLSDVVSIPISWLWYPYIPKGALSTIVGDGGYGKSWMTCALAADLSTGRALPGQDPLPPQKILMLSAEDDIGHVIRPRMEVLQANMENIAVFDEGFTLNPAMVSKILSAMKSFDATVVFLDPMVVYMGGSVDMNKANETRGVLKLLTQVAKDTDTAFVSVHHVRKMGSSSPQHRAMGSADFINGVRSAMLVDISKGGQHYMAHVKSNWAAKGPTLAYNFDGKSFQWAGEYAHSLEEDGEISRSPRGVGKAFLIATLRSGPVPATEVMQRAMDEGINERTLNRAKIGVARSFRTDLTWFWELEDEVLAEVVALEAGKLANPEAKRAEADADEAIMALGRGVTGIQMQEPTAFNDVLARARAKVAAKKAQANHG